jgi:ATP-dependent Lhr-like helicase
MPIRTGPPTAAGRWSLLPAPETDPTRRAHAAAEALLDRHGVVTRGAVLAEHVPGGYAAVYPVLKAFEETGRCRRGYFVEGLGGAQFAMPGAVDRMRAMQTQAEQGPRESPWQPPVPGGWRDRRRRDEGDAALVLAATDPANPYGAALAWPERAGAKDGGAHRPGRKAGALVVLVDGELALYVERGGRTLLSWSEDRACLQPAVDALALAVRDGMLGRLAVERADGEAVLTSPLGAALEQAGFRPTPRGLRLRG